MLFQQVAYIPLQQKNRNEAFVFLNVCQWPIFISILVTYTVLINLFVLYFDRLLFCLCYAKKAQEQF